MSIMKNINSELPSSLKGEILYGKEAISTIATDWDELFQRATAATPYLSRAWISTFISEGRLRGSPLFILVWRGEKLVALLALAIRHFLSVKMAEPIGTGVPSYLGLLLDPDYPEAVELISEILTSKMKMDILCNRDLASTDEATNNLMLLLKQKRYTCFVVHRNICRYIHLGCSYNEYLLNNKKATTRRTLRRDEKRLFNAGEVKIERFSGKNITVEVISRVANIQEQSWMKRRGAAVLSESFYHELLLQMSKAGLGSIWLLSINAVDVAFFLGLISHNRLHGAWMAFNLEFSSLSVGKVLFMQVIRDACNDGFLSFDFGHGDGEYKRFWATNKFEVNRAAVGRGLRGSLIVFYYGFIWWLAKHKWLLEKYRQLKRRLKSVRVQLSSVLVVILALFLVLSNSLVGYSA
jgi:CelD/BcsL family acetyltransferase involved in cellulose biosynthesis